MQMDYFVGLEIQKKKDFISSFSWRALTPHEHAPDLTLDRFSFTAKCCLFLQTSDNNCTKLMTAKESSCR